jgi:peroxiredoxin
MFNQIKSLFKSLAEELKAFVNGPYQELPQAIHKANAIQLEALEADGAAAKALQVNDKAPDFELENQAYLRVRLQNVLDKGPVILSFYRGKWCPFCNIEIKALQRTLEEFQQLGATLIAISPQTTAVTRSFAEEVPLTFEVLSDPGNEVAKAYGLSYTVHSELLNVFAGVGLHLGDFNGEAGANSLPIPATYVVDKKGTIRYAFANADTTQRAEPAEIIAVLKSI